MALNEFNVAGNNVDISDEGVRIWDKPNGYYDAIFIKHDDFKFIASLVESWQKQNQDDT